MTENQNPVETEQRVWLAVIARTVEEWVSGPLRTQMEAEQYLLNDENDFATVCAAAGLDPKSLRAKLLRLKKNGAGPKQLNGVRSIRQEIAPAVQLVEDATLAA